jgi:hypothetical protein
MGAPAGVAELPGSPAGSRLRAGDVGKLPTLRRNWRTLNHIGRCFMPDDRAAPIDWLRRQKVKAVEAGEHPRRLARCTLRTCPYLPLRR